MIAFESGAPLSYAIQFSSFFFSLQVASFVYRAAANFNLFLRFN